MKRSAVGIFSLMTLLLVFLLLTGQSTGPRYVTLHASGAETANVSGAASGNLRDYQYAVITLDITAADRANGDETYDIFVTTSDGTSSWDIVHFPQIVVGGVQRRTAIVNAALLPQDVTTASPGVAANSSATLDTDTAGAAEGIRTLGAGRVRHGSWGDRLAHELVVAGTTPSMTYSLLVTLKP